VTDDNVGIYDNSSGSLVQVGTLVKGQVYPRVADDGDWHQVKFGNGFGYIYKGSTSPVDSANIKNINPGLSNRNQYFIPKAQLSVFDNSSGSLVPFASLNAGMKYPIISVDGDWYQIDVSGRIGYVYRPSTTMPFASTDKYFQVTEDNVGIYDNSTGSLVQVGTLTKGQVYPRISDYGDWHQIRFGNKYGYVWKGSTSVPDNVSLKNENTSGTSNSNLYFTPLQDVTVFDNTSGSLVPFGTINKGTLYQAICVIGDWLQVDLSGRIGYVYKGSVQLGPTTIDNYRNYNYSLNQFLSTQMAAVPQTDMYKNSPAYISKDYVSYMSDANHSPGYYVTADSLNVRELPNSNAGTFIYGTLKKDTQVTVLEDANGWYRILYTWRNAKSADTLPYLDPSLNSKFQHLRLDIPANISADGLNKVLTGKGILSGKGQSFKDAALKYGLNEVYLISHAMLETGNGTSTLASGVPIKVNNGVVTIVDPKNTKPDYTVYNMYGIGAKDSCALQCGVQTAYDKGWFTPELAIVYGAEFVKTDYVGIGQNTLFKMRWNPDFIYVKNGVVYNNYPELSSATHQYATDIGWAVKQAKTMESMYNQFDYYNAVFDIPIFK
jgi:mannosyl-glycoprotein endo-beta-N-acetylglucosaminidase